LVTRSRELFPFSFIGLKGIIIVVALHLFQENFLYVKDILHRDPNKFFHSLGNRQKKYRAKNLEAKPGH
jgi:hypothetical protein